jgi:hypothetical protein
MCTLGASPLAPYPGMVLRRRCRAVVTIQANELALDSVRVRPRLPCLTTMLKCSDNNKGAAAPLLFAHQFSQSGKGSYSIS